MKKSIVQILFLSVILFWVLNACNVETPKGEVAVTDMLIDSLVLKQADTVKPAVVDTTLRIK